MSNPINIAAFAGYLLDVMNDNPGMSMHEAFDKLVSWPGRDVDVLTIKHFLSDDELFEQCKRYENFHGSKTPKG